MDDVILFLRTNASLEPQSNYVLAIKICLKNSLTREKLNTLFLASGICILLDILEAKIYKIHVGIE